MSINDYVAPFALALSGLSIVISSVLIARGRLGLIQGLNAARLRDPLAVAAKFARLLALTGIALLFGGLGLYWAGSEPARLWLVIVPLLIAVNGLGVAMIFAVRAARRGYRPVEGAGQADAEPRTPRR